MYPDISLLGARVKVVSAFLCNNKHLAKIITDYDNTGWPLEAHSKNFYACVKKYYYSYSEVALHDRKSRKVKSFKAFDIQGIAISSCEKTLIVMHKKFKNYILRDLYSRREVGFFVLL